VRAVPVRSTMASNELDFDDVSVPLYRQLAAIIRRMIGSGEIPPRHALPTRAVLMERYGVGARTVRDAMALLRDEGLIRSASGKAFYVVPPGERETFPPR
jgi:DNA-binding GntR family transcriptional regulator